jgi:hypothetical protein
MTKKLKLLFPIAGVVAVVVLIACGSGDVIDISTVIQDIDTSSEKLTGKIESGEIDGHAPSSSSETPPPESSSSKGTPGESSSSQNIVGPSSSSSRPAQSSSSVPVVPSSSSVPKSSSSQAVVAKGDCKENKPKAGFICSWNEKGILLPGVNIKPEFTGGDGCTIAWSYKTSTSQLAKCLETNAAGFTSEGGMVYTLFADLTCSDSGSHTNACAPTGGLSSKAAPSLAGTCKWSKNPTTSARGAEPTGITLIDPDNVCAAKTVAYKYEGNSKTWPSGKVDAGKYTDVYARATNCPAFDVPPAKCPDLDVSGGAEVSVTNLNWKEGNIDFVIPSGECADIEVIDTDNWPDHPIAVYCYTDFIHNETGGNNVGKLELRYNSVVKTAIGSYNVSLQNNGFNLQAKPTISDKLYEFSGLCATTYVNNNEIQKDIKCVLSKNNQE